MSPSTADFVYTVLLRPRLLRSAVQKLVMRLIPPQLEISGVQLAMNRQDPVVCGALSMGCYERFELAVFESLLAPGMTVVDVGANIGLYSAVAAKHVGPAGRVISIEPAPENCRILESTLRLNDFRQVTVVRKAVTDESGEGSLYLCEDNKGDHRIFSLDRQRKRLPIEVSTLDAILRDCAVSKVDVLKVDIQGSEARALKGMTQTLTANEHIRVIMELWPWGIAQAGGDANEALASIRDLGFEIFELDGDKRSVRRITTNAELVLRRLERHRVNLLLQRSGAPSVQPNRASPHNSVHA
jgi:FkbM family methyltransferase